VPDSRLLGCAVLLPDDPHNPRLRADEIVSTGTLTLAMPVTASLNPRSPPKAPSPGSPQAAQPGKVTDQRGRILGIPIWACALLLAIVVARLMTRILRIG